uniref:UBA domain-containing protein n=1 Tax=Ascaris lumbricoides TaxID=6252 RepID=A0A9J2P4J5_ASCLU
MGGRGETSDQKIRATQDQLRLARITQDVSSVDDDRANVQKLIKKVVETTRCTVSQAEIALYDTDNNVEEAVNAILEEAYSDESVWKEQKSRRAKRAEAEERAEELSSAHRNRNHLTRSANNFSGSGRGRGSERGRGGFRGGARGGGRGTFMGRGGYQQSGILQSGSASGASNVWDNSQATKNDSSKEWTNASTNSVDDVPEDTDWKTAGTLVFSRRDDATPPAPPTLSASSGVGGSSSCSASAPISFAAVAAAGASKNKESVSVPKSSANTSLNSSLGSAAAPPTNSVTQPTLDNLSSLYQNKSVVSTSGQSAVSSQDADTERDDECASATPTSMSGMMSTSPSVAKVSSTVPTTTIQRTALSTVNTSSADWTAQLKNDLGIGTKPTPQVAPKQQQSQPPQAAQPAQQQTARTKQTSVARPLASMMQQPPVSHTVEFVSGGDSNGPSALPEYQFGFHVESTANAGDERGEDVFTASAKPRSMNRSAKIETELPSESSAPILSNGVVGDFSSSISSQQQSKNVTSNGGVGIVSATPATHSSTTAMQRQPVSSGLSYADTSSMSYPSSEGRNATAKPSLSLHQQQQAQHQLYTATQIPYNSYPYLNMYSPVTGVRQDEAQYAAALVQYPFGVGQIDMSSLSTMIPPAALASQQQASQPPPPVQGQHQQRPDQHGNYVDLKAYAAAAAVANSTAGGGSGSALLGSQQQRDSTSVSGSAVAPPPGFSGPPSNMPTAAFTLPQHNHISSLFQMPPTYHPQLNQLPFSFMLPNVTGSAQHKLNHQMFAQQAVDDTLSDQRLSSQQQKVYGGHQQMDKYGGSTGGKDRLGGGAQATPPPQMYQPQAPQGYLSQQMPLHAHNKKTYGNGPQHWSAS